MVKVLQIGMTSNIGGMETYIMSQYRHLDKSRIQYDFLNITGENDIAFSSEILNGGSTIYNVVSRHINPLKHYLEIIQLLWKIRNEYKAIVLNTCHLYYMFPIFIAMMFQYPKRIVHSHNSGDELPITFKRKILISLNSLLMNLSATDYWACSNLAGKWMFKKKKFIVIHNAIEMKRYLYNESKRENIRLKFGLKDNYVIGNVARFTFQKNHLFLIDIFREIYRRDNAAVLLLIGDITCDDSIYMAVKNKVRTYGLEKNVFFLGMRQDVNDLYQGMDCFILPSKFEGLPVTGIEIQAAGVPCVFSDAITKEVAITDDVVFMSLNESPMMWAKKVLSMKKCKRKNRSKEIIVAGYDINEEVKKVAKLYQE